METNKLLKSFSTRKKVLQKFILGFSGERINNNNSNIQKLIKEGLGGVILFGNNITSYGQTQELSTSLQNIAQTPLFISIDQEGGIIERTSNIKNRLKYYSPGKLGEIGNLDYAKVQAEIMVKELNALGVNMNFAPVMDVNTNPKNPVIGSRSFGNNPDIVVNFARQFYEIFTKNSIIPVIKHFPGHGPTGEDSHLTMPSVDMPLEELENIHIKPFKQAVEEGINTIMINHVHYKIFNDKPVPSSLSYSVIQGYLRKKLGFKGLVFSDDMVMGSVKNHFDYYDACVKAINAGIDVLIFRNSDDETLNIIEEICMAVETGIIEQREIDSSVERILDCKSKYGFWTQKPNKINFEPEKLQNKIDKLNL